MSKTAAVFAILVGIVQGAFGVGVLWFFEYCLNALAANGFDLPFSVFLGAICGLPGVGGGILVLLTSR